MKTQEQFETYDRNNPTIWVEFKHFAKEMASAGYKCLSAQMVIERIRWETGVVAKLDPFKINNDYAAFYARKWNKTFPELPQFRLREHGIVAEAA